LKYHKSRNTFPVTSSDFIKFECHSIIQEKKHSLESVDAFLLSHITKYESAGTLYSVAALDHLIKVNHLLASLR
jgi:hypothetical protein